MPKGEFNPCSSTERRSATPSPLLSRSKVMRLALGRPAPALFITRPISQDLMPLAASGLGGASLSATSTSPLGSTNSQRGWSRPLANAFTRVPAAPCGITPSDQPFAGAMFTVGISVRCGCGKVGCGPVPSETVNVAISPQPASARPSRPTKTPSKSNRMSRPTGSRLDVHVVGIGFCTVVVMDALGPRTVRHVGPGVLIKTWRILQTVLLHIQSEALVLRIQRQGVPRHRK